ncbi:hypothetical protein BDN70DRAFT_930591 [Pholiota conissans]|uniref:Uncharacterized protein n=1 Tax=Pholiota conissans TaxID=109636 RepID=A0A9P5Z5F7_9AGAR|nr:hypothetical protein BDN70DRAFT_930591 [Pholiota conissans]
MNIDEDIFIKKPSEAVENAETRRVYGVGGYSYTFGDLETFAKKFKLTWTIKSALLIAFESHLRRNKVANIPDLDQLVTLYDDSHAELELCFIMGHQYGRRPLSHRFRPDVYDELIRRVCAETFGFSENPPFRTVKDPYGREYPPLSREWRELPDWYDEVESTSGNSALAHE